MRGFALHTTLIFVSAAATAGLMDGALNNTSFTGLVYGRMYNAVFTALLQHMCGHFTWTASSATL
jgi:hypothetical protein